MHQSSERIHLILLMIRRPPRSTLFPTRRSSDLGRARLPLPAAAEGGDRRRFAPDAAAALLPLPSRPRSEEHTSELQSRRDLVCRLLLEKKKITTKAG